MKLVKTPAENPSNSFITKIDRFAPTAPGSSVFKQSTYVDNPGPGTYTISAMKPQRPKSADNSSQVQAMKVHNLKLQTKAVPPAIPSRKSAADAYTGLKNDTVGPAVYSPKNDLVRP